MCGIVGYVGERRALPLLEEGLSNLEYRGYDSAGIALVGDTLRVFKRKGAIDDLRADLPADAPETCGVGHTRWSTHGGPSDANAHPHTDPEGRVAVVHNGIVENYETIEDEFADQPFTSETDTEVIAHLVARELDEDGAFGGPNGGPPPAALHAALERTVERLEGSFAVAVTVAGCDAICVARQDSPLVLGLADDGTFVGSDVTAFLEHARDVVYLEDGDVGLLSDGAVTIHNEGRVVERSVETVEWEAEAAEKGGYEHYMLKEIHEQPTALRQTLAGRIGDGGTDVTLDVDLDDETLRTIDDIQIVACGTSAHAGMYAARLLEDAADLRTTVTIASEYDFDGGRDPERTLVLAVTQSGETADTLAALRSAVDAGAHTLAVTNTLGSTVTRVADESCFIKAGPEIGVAATKTFVSQVATLALFAVHCGRVREAMGATESAEWLSDLRGLPGGVQQTLDREDRIREVATEYVDSEAFFFVGRHLGYPVALEGALKLKEIAYVHAEGFAAGELKHGPLALVTPETPVLAILTDGTKPAATVNNVKEVQSRGAPVIGCSSHDPAERYLDAAFDVPDLGVVEPLVANVQLQLFAYHVADHLGRSIDKPRNLAKSVTVE
jgi:glucosamine--fructose-6-phosphate aminotransferase (isomerizing)